MGNLIDFKSKRVLKEVNSLNEESEKQRTIHFLENLINDLKRDKLDPEECLVVMKWSTGDNSERCELHYNDSHLNSVIAMLKQAEHAYLRDMNK